MTQDTHTPPSVEPKVEDPLTIEGKKLDLEKKIIDNRKASADADKAETQALQEKWKISQTKGKEGTVTVGENAGYYSELLAYRAIDPIAVEILNKLNKVLRGGGRLIILGKEDLATQATLWNLLYLKLENAITSLDNCISDYERILESKDKNGGLDEVFTAVPAILGAAADIVAFFKTNYAISSREILLNEKAVKAGIAIQLKSIEKLQVFLPEYNITLQGKLFEKLSELNTKIGGLRKIKENKKIQSKPEEEKLRIITDIDEEISAVQELITALTTKTDNSLSPLETVSVIDFIKKHPEAKILYLIISSQGAEIETAISSFKQGSVSYLGGAVITYFLSNADGECLHSGNVQEILTGSFQLKKGLGTLIESDKTEDSQKNKGNRKIIRKKKIT